MNKYYYAIDNKQYGPLSYEAIEKMVEEGKIEKETLIWQKGMTDWQFAKSIMGLSDLFEEIPPPLPKIPKLPNIPNLAHVKNKEVTAVENIEKNYVAWVQDKDTEKYKLINTKGDVVLNTNYEYVDHFYEGLAAVQTKKESCGFINIQNELVIQDKYVEFHGGFNGGLANVATKSGGGYIDKYGLEIIPCIYDMTTKPSGGIVSASRKRKGIFFNKNGEEIFKIYKIYSISSFREGLAIVEKNTGILGGEKYGFVDERLNEVIAPLYNKATLFSNGVSAVQNKRLKYGVIDKNNRVVADFKYNYITLFSDGLAYFSLKERNKETTGFIDIYGNEVIKGGGYYSRMSWKDGGDIFFNDGMAVFYENNRCGIINKNGSVIVHPKYICSNGISEGIAIMKSPNGVVLLNNKGEKIKTDNYDSISLFENGYSIVSKNHLYGFIDKLGNEVVPLKYRECMPFTEPNESPDYQFSGRFNTYRIWR